MRARLENSVVRKYGTLPSRYLIGATYVNLETMDDSVKDSEGFFTVQPVVVLEHQSAEPLIETDLVNDFWIERVRDWTAQEIADYIEAQLELAEESILETELVDGKNAALKLKVYLKRNLTVNQYKNARILVRPVWDALRAGDWDIALDEITIIDDANSTAISQKIKTHIENYLD